MKQFQAGRLMLQENADNADLSEYFVRVEWLNMLSEVEAIGEVGLFGSQNTVCQPVTSPKQPVTFPNSAVTLPKRPVTLVGNPL